MVASTLLALTLQSSLTFETLEKNKHKAFSELTAFHGTYLVISQPTGRAATRQEIEISASSAGRRVKISLNKSALAESAWTNDQKWVVNHTARTYVTVAEPGKIPVVEAWKALPVQKGRANFTVDHMGPQFITDPAATVTKQEDFTESGKQYTRIEAVANNPDAKGSVKIIQVFDKGTWITRRFILELTGPNGKLLEVFGELKDDNRNPVAASAFVLPPKLVEGYTKVENKATGG